MRHDNEPRRRLIFAFPSSPPLLTISKPGPTTARTAGKGRTTTQWTTRKREPAKHYTPDGTATLWAQERHSGLNDLTEQPRTVPNPAAIILLITSAHNPPTDGGFEGSPPVPPGAMTRTLSTASFGPSAKSLTTTSTTTSTAAMPVDSQINHTPYRQQHISQTRAARPPQRHLNRRIARPSRVHRPHINCPSTARLHTSENGTTMSTAATLTPPYQQTLCRPCHFDNRNFDPATSASLATTSHRHRMSTPRVDHATMTPASTTTPHR